MPRKLADRNRFASEEQEADWYATPAGRRQTQREFAQALRDGTITHSAGRKARKSDANFLLQLLNQAKQNATRAISIRVPISDLERAKQIAERTGEGYQTVLKRAIRTGLKRAG